METADRVKGGFELVLTERDDKQAIYQTWVSLSSNLHGFHRYIIGQGVCERLDKTKPTECDPLARHPDRRRDQPRRAADRRAARADHSRVLVTVPAQAGARSPVPSWVPRLKALEPIGRLASQNPAAASR